MCEKLSLFKRIAGVFTGKVFGDCAELASIKDSEINTLSKELKKCNTKLDMANDDYVVIKNEYNELDDAFREKINLLRQKDIIIEDYTKSINKLKNELMLLKNDLTRSQSESKAIIGENKILKDKLTKTEAYIDTTANENKSLIAKLKACNTKLSQTLKDIAEKSKELIPESCTPPKRTTKLTCEEIVEARRLYKTGDALTDIAGMLGVSDSTLSKAINCKTYKQCCEKAKPVKAKTTTTKAKKK